MPRIENFQNTNDQTINFIKTFFQFIVYTKSFAYKPLIKSIREKIVF
ncbi:hypothetical protein LEP1GSC107_3497 [Leptospira interrogans serovar Grippotyphosa str. UI 12769]|uniref:Uncharacterized protein n=1 Tax=Leptospira interrogans str. FPW1039 TaxID=1193040 RepID=A0A0F6IJK9_LEPIR|nr:hypothetical protein LEP1GSC097_0802 [Leptospira interrogans serovar Grippotyphosa str. UI 08368]EMJ38234.1 hypothetical protein LEP1GSC079_4994 [Leptospira interrogans str. FPW1039]EMK19089.1 hypothetical protein LEP1GSC075_1865 [Leptospira interrogans str. Kito]EMN55337.1 hypothetical protein LEP1GSC089_3841 [Leptospira interrogans serovar Autumnalis str. LP101]EMN87572.1 hypothetical protein LEP1GSC107_3497 [Leptospira interrogans serovar Grippotyphosa str. UI 12769]EMO02111.1 hypothetic